MTQAEKAARYLLGREIPEKEALRVYGWLD